MAYFAICVVRLPKTVASVRLQVAVLHSVSVADMSFHLVVFEWYLCVVPGEKKT